MPHISYFAKKYNLTLIANDSKLYDSAKSEEIEVLKSNEFQEQVKNLTVMVAWFSFHVAY